MKYLANVLKRSLLLFTILILNYLPWNGLDNGRPLDCMLNSVIYFGLFSGLIVLSARSRNPTNKIGYLILLLLLFPCLYLKKLEGSSDISRLSFVGGLKLEIGSWLGSLGDLCSYFLYRFASARNSPHSPMIAYQAYSIVLAIFLTAIVRHSGGEGMGLYRKAGIWVLTGVGLTAGYLLMADYASVKDLQSDFLSAYLQAYVLLLLTYVVLRKTTLIRKPIPLVLAILLLFFPVVSIMPGTYNVTTADTVPHYTGAIGIAPLAFAFPFTLKQLVMDTSLEGQLWPFSVKLYTLLQVCIVFFALPSVLLPKKEKNNSSELPQIPVQEFMIPLNQINI